MTKELITKNLDNIYINKFLHYIDGLSIDKTYKKILTNKKFISNNPSFYLYYPKLFSSAFNLPRQNIDKLCKAGYLYYQSTLFLDSVIDDNRKEKIVLVTICQEEAIKLLTAIFGLQSIFWTLWNKRRHEYFKAIQIEKELSTQKKSVTIERYAKLAAYKATFGKAAIDAVFILSNEQDKRIYELILKSHDFFSVAYQLNDDIQDFKQDFKNEQFNWAYYLIKQDSDIQTNDISKLNKLLYIKGYTKKIFLIAIEFLDKAMDVVKDIDIPLWKSNLNETKKKCLNSIIEIDNYLEILNTEVSLSTKLIKNNTLSKSISKAVDFIKSNQKSDGSWHEYINQGGISNIWSTAYITSKLSGKFLKSIFKKELLNAIEFLKINKKDKLWGYNSTWIEDADTTNFAILSFFLNDIEIKKSTINNWYSFQTTNGGFSTYKDKQYLIESLTDKQIMNVSGWITTHHCVSAVSFYFLALANDNSQNFINLKRFFDNLIINKVVSYWWTSSVYTYHYLALSYHKLGEHKKVKTILNIVRGIQNKNGSFSDKYGENLFYTGLALEVLLLEVNTFNKEIEATINYLLQHQYQDGTWDNSNSLQVPDANNLTPRNIYFPIASHGTNVRANEFNRLFTTTTVLKALNIYEKTRINTQII